MRLFFIWIIHKTARIVFLICLLPLMLMACSDAKQSGQQNEFDGWERVSQYIEMRDGVRLAVDTYRPTRNGKLHERPLPVVWMHTPYHRQKLDKNGARQSHEVLPPLHEGADELLKSGYVFAAVDARGYGASFGSADVWIGPQQTEDSYDLIDWFATQSWSSGKVGMTGRSYLATAQFFAAASGHPALKAIFPEMGGFDNYNIFYTNGIYRHDLAIAWDQAMAELNNAAPGKPNGVAPVDQDKTGELLKQAILNHQENRSIHSTVIDAKFRDSELSDSNIKPHVVSSPSSLLTQIEKSNVAIYQRAGWFDLNSKDAILFFRNLKNPQKLVIGPWYHREHFGFDREAEKVRWFDYWLKDIDNGIMSEPSIRYYTVGASSEKGWKNSDTWPLERENRETYFLTNTHQLSKIEPLHANSATSFEVDYDVSLGSTLVRNNGLWPDRQQDCANQRASDWCSEEAGYPERISSKGVLQFTSGSLEQDLTIVGHPVVELFTSANQSDFDLFVILEEVRTDGSSHYISQGGLLASHRTINDPLHDHLNLPWLGNYIKYHSLMTKLPEKIAIDLYPSSNIFEAGHRIRLTITGADAGSHASSQKQSNTEINIFTGLELPSSLTLPVIETQKAED